MRLGYVPSASTRRTGIRACLSLPPYANKQRLYPSTAILHESEKCENSFLQDTVRAHARIATHACNDSIRRP